MRTLYIAWFLIAALAVPLWAAPPTPRNAPPKNRTVAALAGAALHLAQNARALQTASLKKRQQQYGPNDPQVKAGRRNLRVIRQKQRYFRQVKRRDEGRRPLTRARRSRH